MVFIDRTPLWAWLPIELFSTFSSKDAPCGVWEVFSESWAGLGVVLGGLWSHSGCLWSYLGCLPEGKSDFFEGKKAPAGAAKTSADFSEGEVTFLRKKKPLRELRRRRLTFLRKKRLF